MAVKGIFLADQVVHGTFLYVEGKWEKVKRQQRALPQCTEIIMEEGEAVVRQPWKCSLLFIPPPEAAGLLCPRKHNNNWYFKFPRIKTKPGCRFPEWRSDTKSCDMTSPDVFRSWMSSFSVCQWYDTPFVYLPVQTHQEKGWFWWISHTQFFLRFWDFSSSVETAHRSVCPSGWTASSETQHHVSLLQIRYQDQFHENTGVRNCSQNMSWFSENCILCSGQGRLLVSSYQVLPLSYCRIPWTKKDICITWPFLTSRNPGGKRIRL